MKALSGIRFHGLLITAFLLQACASTGTVGTGDLTEEGLQRLEIEGMDFVAVHPGARFNAFSEIYIEPVTLEFREGWRPMTTGSQMSASRHEIDQLQENLEQLFMQQFTAGVKQNSRLRIVSSPTPDALRVSPRLQNVTMANFGNKMSAGQSAGRKLGQVELKLVVHDVETGTLVVRLDDLRVIGNPNSGFAVMGAARTEEAFAELFNGWGGFVGDGLFNIGTDIAER